MELLSPRTLLAAAPLPPPATQSTRRPKLSPEASRKPRREATLSPLPREADGTLVTGPRKPWHPKPMVQGLHPVTARPHRHDDIALQPLLAVEPADADGDGGSAALHAGSPGAAHSHAGSPESPPSRVKRDTGGTSEAPHASAPRTCIGSPASPAPRIGSPALPAPRIGSPSSPVHSSPLRGSQPSRASYTPPPMPAYGRFVIAASRLPKKEGKAPSPTCSASMIASPAAIVPATTAAAAAPATDAPSAYTAEGMHAKMPSKKSWFSNTVNLTEELTGYDIDGDGLANGDAEAPSAAALLSEFFRSKVESIKRAATHALERCTGLDLDGDGTIADQSICVIEVSARPPTQTKALVLPYMLASRPLHPILLAALSALSFLPPSPPRLSCRPLHPVLLAALSALSFLPPSPPRLSCRCATLVAITLPSHWRSPSALAGGFRRRW